MFAAIIISIYGAGNGERSLRIYSETEGSRTKSLKGKWRDKWDRSDIDSRINKFCRSIGKLNYLGFRLGTRALLGKRRRDELLRDERVYERFSRAIKFDRFGARIPIGNHSLVFSPDNSRFLVQDDVSRGILEDIYFGHVYDKLNHPRTGNVVVDAGAHVGLYSIKASKLVGREGRVLAFEPHPLNYAILNSNIRLNGIKNIETICYALGESDGYVKLYLANPNSGGHSIMPRSIMRRTEEFLLVNVKRLDTAVKEYQVQRLDFIKMDVEGAELLLLKGAEKILREFKPNLAIAAYHYPKEIDELSHYLGDYCYKLYRLRQSFLYAEPEKP